MFASLYSNIKAHLSATLPDHTALPFEIEVERNRQGSTRKGYGVSILSSQATGELVGATTLDVTVEVKLSDKYEPNRNNDSAQQAVSQALAERCLDAFKSLASSKLGGTSGVRNVTLREISDANFLDDEKTVFRSLTLSANVKV
jgi:uncharacterized phage protein gp47/JayE